MRSMAWVRAWMEDDNLSHGFGSTTTISTLLAPKAVSCRVVCSVNLVKSISSVLISFIARTSVAEEVPTVDGSHQAEAIPPVQINWSKAFHYTEFLSGFQTAIAATLNQAKVSNREVNHMAQVVGPSRMINCHEQSRPLNTQLARLRCLSHATVTRILSPNPTYGSYPRGYTRCTVSPIDMQS